MAGINELADKMNRIYLSAGDNPSGAHMDADDVLIQVIEYLRDECATPYERVRVNSVLAEFESLIKFYGEG